MFITDRDLLVLQPSLFREVSHLAQTLFRGPARIVSGQLLATAAPFPSSVRPGHVALVGDLALEIVSIINSTTLLVSLTRASAADPVISPSDVAAVFSSIATFDPQSAVIHAQILRMLGLEASRAADPNAPGESAVLNPGDLKLVESCGTLHLVYASAAAPLNDGSILAARADHYRERFAQERWRARAIIDTDGDGRADAVRTLHIRPITRA